MGHGFNFTICPQPLGWNDRHKAAAAAVIVERAESLTELEVEAIEAATGNDDPTTYVDAILEAWDAVVADQEYPSPLIASLDLAENDTWQAGRFWLSGDIGDHNVEQEHLTLLRESGVCDEPMPWYEAPAVTCGYPVPTGVPETTPCELGRWHRGEGHRVTLEHATVTVTDNHAPEGAGPWPPVVVVTRDSEGPTWVEQFGCDAVVVVIDNGSTDLGDPVERGEWEAGLRAAAAALGDDHPAGTHIIDTIELELDRRDPDRED